MPLTSLSSDDLPQPLGPMMLVTFPCANSIDSPLNKTRSPYPNDTSLSCTLAIEPSLPATQNEVDEERPAQQRQDDADGDFVRGEYCAGEQVA